MKVREIEEIEADFKEVFENKDVYALSQWYARGPEPLGKPEPFNEKEYLRRAMEDAKAIPKILEAIDGI